MIKFSTDHSQAIEKLAEKMSYIDAIILYCQSNEIDEETIAMYVKKHPNLLAAVTREAEALRIIPKSDHIPKELIP